MMMRKSSYTLALLLVPLLLFGTGAVRADDERGPARDRPVDHGLVLRRQAASGRPAGDHVVGRESPLHAHVAHQENG